MRHLIRWAFLKFRDWAIDDIRNIFDQWLLLTIVQVWNSLGGLEASFIGELWNHASQFLDIVWYVDTALSLIGVIIRIYPRWFGK